MDDLFEPPGTSWHRVSPQLATVRRWSLVGVAALVVVLVVAARVAGLADGVPTWGWPVGAAAAAAVLVSAWWGIGRSAAHWGYAETDEELYIVRGALFRRLVVVPYGRMQFVDVQTGPVDRLVGIAKVQLHTASPGTTAVIPGLEPQEATRLRDRLTARGESQAAGL